MKSVFAVTLSRGSAWDSNRARREQKLWNEHAQFMDQLLADGFVILGGPYADDSDVLLIVEANTETEVHDTLARDPWHSANLLTLVGLRAWHLWLDCRQVK